MTILADGQSLPPITGRNTDGETVDVADLTAGSWAVVLFYRGHW